MDQLDHQLRRLHSSTEALFEYRRALANSTGSLAKALAALSTAEEDSELSGALSQLSAVQEKMELIHSEQASADFYQLSEMVKDHVGMVGAVKDVFQVIFLTTSFLGQYLFILLNIILGTCKSVAAVAERDCNADKEARGQGESGARREIRQSCCSSPGDCRAGETTGNGAGQFRQGFSNGEERGRAIRRLSHGRIQTRRRRVSRGDAQGARGSRQTMGEISSRDTANQP